MRVEMKRVLVRVRLTEAQQLCKGKEIKAKTCYCSSGCLVL